MPLMLRRFVLAVRMTNLNKLQLVHRHGKEYTEAVETFQQTATLTSQPSLLMFRRQLKTLLFEQSFS